MIQLPYWLFWKFINHQHNFHHTPYINTNHTVSANFCGPISSSTFPLMVLVAYYDNVFIIYFIRDHRLPWRWVTYQLPLAICQYLIWSHFPTLLYFSFDNLFFGVSIVHTQLSLLSLRVIFLPISYNCQRRDICSFNTFTILLSSESKVQVSFSRPIVVAFSIHVVSFLYIKVSNKCL